METRSSIKGKFLGLVIACALSCSMHSLASAAESGPDDPAWRKSVEKIVEDYIRNRPELIEQALQALEKKREAEEQARVKTEI